MPRFAFLIEVENNLVNWDGEMKPVGCFVTRVEQAVNVSTARDLAIARVRDELILKGELLNEAVNPPRFKTAESRRLRFWDRTVDTGFGYFDDADEP